MCYRHSKGSKTDLFFFMIPLIMLKKPLLRRFWGKQLIPLFFTYDLTVRTGVPLLFHALYNSLEHAKKISI